MAELKKAPGIVPAVDMSLGKALVYSDKLRGLTDEITGLKIGSDIVDEYGFLTAARLFTDIGSDIPWILDMQKRGTDVPFMIERQVKMAPEYGVAAYIGSPLGAGSNSDTEKIGSLQAFVKSCSDNDIVPIIVLEMTQPGASYFLKEGASEDLAKLSIDLGVKYFVAPANKPERLEVYREIIGNKGEIISPGSGPQKTGDVVKDAVNAIEAGADHLVIGRGIYKAHSPVDTAKRVFEAIDKAYQKRQH